MSLEGTIDGTFASNISVRLFLFGLWHMLNDNILFINIY